MKERLSNLDLSVELPRSNMVQTGATSGNHRRKIVNFFEGHIFGLKFKKSGAQPVSSLALAGAVVAASAEDLFLFFFKPRRTLWYSFKKSVNETTHH